MAGMLLIGVGKKPGRGADMMSKDEESSDDATKEGRVSAMKAFIKAVKSGDAEGADEALQTHYALCAEHGEESEEDDY